MTLESQQRDCVRELGRKVYQLAVSDEYQVRRQRWRDVNALRKPDRSPVWCKPIGCWPELLAESDLECPDGFYRDVERLFRHYLIKDDIGDDSLIQPCWAVPAAIQLDGEHEWGVEIKHVQPESPGGAWRFDPPIEEEADLEKLKPPAYSHNVAETQRRLETYSELFDGIMPVKVAAAVPTGAHLGNVAAELLGLDNMMLNLAIRPEMMHRLMGFLRAGVLRAMDEVEAMGVLTQNNNGEMYCSDSLKTSGAGVPVKISDLWGQANSQEFELVSPEMWREFLLDYQKPFLERYGLISYGCCENLTHKMDGVLTVSNLRIFVCSAWTDLAKLVDLVGDRYTIMWRQKASDVVYAAGLEPVRRHLNEGMKLSQGCFRQIVLRELQTLNGNPRRLHDWAALAKEAATKYN